MTDARHSPAQLSPGATIGILGGGQLGRMLCQAAAQLGFKTHIYCPDEKSPAGEVASAWTRGAYTDEEDVSEFVRSVDVVTYEFENIPLECIDIAKSTDTPLYPDRKALEVSQDRLTEKRFLKDLDIETAPFMPVNSAEAVGFAKNVTGLPAILKTRRFGYDGKGQMVIHDDEELENAWTEMADAPAIMEGFVNFEREISVIIVRTGTLSLTFDPAENEHRDGILRKSTVPAAITDETAQAAHETAEKIAEELDYIGVLAVEFFVEKSGLLRVNEIAPRVHNSGHWTMDACALNQFEAHIRAICGWPIPSLTRHSDAVMENLIGDDAARWLDIAKDKSASVTLYGKKEMRPGRKMGHVTYLKAKS